VAALLYATLAFAQIPPAVPRIASGVVSGIVSDPSDAVVSGAVVTLKSRGRTAGQTTTDAKGEFSFEAIADGPHELLAEYSGFK